ncbi:MULTISPECIES: o-succinylbenzoate--CoA ligase [unclassified Staphylococcus]|uniref:o-succinylbenzoate--CoA ligase n=1 Tax=unclassified Staphylococcus TaxID=91994 RepID=UPI0021CFB228|nr:MULTISPECIES: o-succinylbenzoate--CoA ligase [unclassified Staphylococcus]UXR79076.1 o-succinylbenzoate--CoA ligase [Staphylococcus sp. IVB6227]UXR81827.1 o-succinylbenzoate--CoA ligase [Staphylococcus sp. IVB6214]
MESWLIQRVKKTPNAIAVETEHQQLSFQQLFEIALQYGSGLTMLNDKRLGLLVDNSLESLALIHGAWLFNIEIALINNRLTDEEIIKQMKSIDVKTIIVSDKYQSRCRKTQLSQQFQCLTSSDVLDYEATSDSPEFDETAIASIMFTSGTTGTQKAVPQTFLNHKASAKRCWSDLGFNKETRWLTVLPIYHISGLSIVIRSVLYGFTVYLMDRFDEQQVMNAIKYKNITHMSLVPLTLKRLMHAGLTRPYALEKILLGGAKLERDFVMQALSYELPIYNSFGMTETCSQFLTASPALLAKNPEAVGKFDSQLKISQSNQNGHGELCVRGDNVMRGYLYPKGLTETFDEDGFFMTGDIASIDTNGFVIIHDRRKDLIISGGENIYPNEIERIAKKHTDVVDAMCVGVKDDYWGQRPILYLVGTSHEAEMFDYLSRHLAKYKLPKEIKYVQSLPYTSTGKLKRQLLNGE